MAIVCCTRKPVADHEHRFQLDGDDLNALSIDETRHKRKSVTISVTPGESWQLTSGIIVDGAWYKYESEHLMVTVMHSLALAESENVVAFPRAAANG